MGTSVPLTFYTDIQCETPSTLTPNASLALGVCAVTPGLGSVHVPSVSCSSGTVYIWAFSDVTCVNVDDIFNLGNGCEGRAVAGAYAAIMLNCNEESPGTPTGTTTIKVGPIATGGSLPSVSASPESPGQSTGSGSTSSTTGGWDSLSTGAKAGIIVGCGAALLLILAIWNLIEKRYGKPGPEVGQRGWYQMSGVNESSNVQSLRMASSGQDKGPDTSPYVNSGRHTAPVQCPTPTSSPPAYQYTPPSNSYSDISATGQSRQHNGNAYDHSGTININNYNALGPTRSENSEYRPQRLYERREH